MRAAYLSTISCSIPGPMSTHPWAVSTHSTVNRKTDRCLWKHYLPATTVVGGKNSVWQWISFQYPNKEWIFVAYLFIDFSILLQSLRYICNIGLKVVNNSKIRIRTASTFIRNLNVFVRPWNKNILDMCLYVCVCMRLSCIEEIQLNSKLSQCTHWQAATASEHLLG